MKTLSTRALRILATSCVLLTIFTPWLHGQTVNKDALPAVEGTVCDSQAHPIAGAVVSLETSAPRRTITSTTDPHGRFRFASLSVGSYTLRAKGAGYQDGREGPFTLQERETKSLTLHLAKTQSPSTATDSSGNIAFSDEPAFTVAGVTDTSALGGHGSGPVVRSSNALSKETASLARGGPGKADNIAHDPARGEPSREAAIRAALAHDDSADLRVQLAEIEESEGHPLEAVKDYQRAAELQPTEPHLFAWGAELLLHHAPEPAVEVFTKGHHLFPQSSRMLLGLGAARYAQNSKEQAEQIFLQACDLNPADPIPYLFLGMLQESEKIEPSGWTERMKRFVSLHPENAMAHYLYAVALIKQDRNQENFAAIERQLNTAIELDAHLGNAYLQLGILRADREDYPGAIAALQRAIENTPMPEEAHYRLAQVYRRMGEAEKSRKEIERFKQISEQKDKEAERERHEIPQFVYTLRGQNPPSKPHAPAPD
jgi:tetratricopeptide (TPR) repeat protein